MTVPFCESEQTHTSLKTTHPGNFASGYSGTLGSMIYTLMVPLTPFAVVSTSLKDCLMSIVLGLFERIKCGRGEKSSDSSGVCSMLQLQDVR